MELATQTVLITFALWFNMAYRDLSSEPKFLLFRLRRQNLQTQIAVIRFSSEAKISFRKKNEETKTVSKRNTLASSAQ
jgi:hypothetical protein